MVTFLETGYGHFSILFVISETVPYLFQGCEGDGTGVQLYFYMQTRTR